ncbi:MAG: SPOR domain-containing protein [Alloprevotella sp.]|nr:SPOR domain-containing protein [Prevotellamassilia sp.]MDY2623807.1 SPOR domain-containing protein [Alloprevotella sp.]MDY2779338.1 SPOR domain-containing protein [Alloprevotella sp.]
MKKLTLILLAVFAITLSAMAQTPFTQHVRTQRAGEGKVRIIQDSIIEKVVNQPMTGKTAKPGKTTGKTDKTTTKPKDDTATHHDNAAAKHDNTEHENADDNETNKHVGSAKTTTMTAYRIQIFSGSNSHQDKQKAYDLAAKCKEKFPELSVYTKFVSPRWVCRVGDFKNLADAQNYASKIRAAHFTREVRIVKTTIRVKL